MQNTFIEWFIDYLSVEKNLNISDDDKNILKENISSYGTYRIFRSYSKPFYIHKMIESSLLSMQALKRFYL